MSTLETEQRLIIKDEEKNPEGLTRESLTDDQGPALKPQRNTTVPAVASKY